MEETDKNSAFTLRLSEEANEKLVKLKKAHKRSKTKMIEMLIMEAKLPS